MTTTLMTADDLLRLPDDGNQYELVRGELVCMPPSSYKPSMVATRIAGRVAAFVDAHHLGIYAGEAGGVILTRDPDTVRAPDFSFVRAERVPPGGFPQGYWPGAPDLAVEVISPSDRLGKVLEKVQDYLDAGTRLVWVIDPEARTATVFRPGAAPVTLGEDGVLDGEDVLPGFTLPLREVWV